MRGTNASFARMTLPMLAIGMLLLIVIVISSLWLVNHTQNTFEFINGERQIRRTAADLMQNLVDAETGQRGFLLTQDESFLEPYEAALSKIRRNQALIAKLVKDRPAKEKRLQKLDELVAAKMAELASTITLAKSDRVADAIAVVKTEYGRKIMEDIQEILEFFKDKSDENVAIGVSTLSEATNQLQWVTVGGAIAIIVVMGGAIGIITQHVRALSSARREVESLNAGLEERVNERTEDLMRANQEIQRFAYIVTHDLRAPLVNIMGFTAELDASLKALQAYVLADGGTLSEDQIKEARLAAAEDLPEAIDFIRSSTKKMDGLINAILKISRDGRRQLKPERIDLTALIEATSASVHHQIAEGDGEVQVDVRVPFIVTDRFSLEQIFGNLFDNAVKYKQPGRPLTLAVRVLPEGRNMVRIEVEDNGRGIADEDHERIFELFRRSGQQDKSGEGIGLAHVRSLARNLGGEITVRSKMRSGSTFVLRLPSDLARIIRS
ncbi:MULTISPECIES: sensor histidine kinase [Alphaproteobacteria]|uniref:histidine kinase n=2 Tax=Alphaproteobacteria TaxID=28211 RepID=A0A512HDZ2_9HYPH|nr:MULTISPECIES: CHASE3 domain-containing protein [Alphaproteobacteria]GEO83671.1 sensor histidine kinase [Ciceribacter naphthalenivorans]GLR24177.1 sensor histidine kinase [Ciceribacter naphthalenivorans]GLT07033.1 sensor histidine kinase [Sphingomonas psychrolutea]